MLFFYRGLSQTNFMFTMICFVMKMKYLVILNQNLMKVSFQGDMSVQIPYYTVEFGTYSEIVLGTQALSYQNYLCGMELTRLPLLSVACPSCGSTDLPLKKYQFVFLLINTALKQRWQQKQNGFQLHCKLFLSLLIDFVKRQHSN